VLRLGFFAGIFLAVTFVVSAQPTTVKTLEGKLAKINSDSAKVNLLNQLSLEYLTFEPKKSTQFAQEALQLAKQVAYKAGEIVALNRLGENEFRRSQHANAVSFATQSLRLAEEAKDSINIAFAYRLLGLINTLGLRQYELALNYQLKALAIFKKENNPKRLATLYGNITWIYAIMNKDLEVAKEMAIKGVIIADSLKDLRLLSYNYNSLGLIYKSLHKFDSSLYFIEKSTLIGKEIQDRGVIVYNKIIKGDIFFATKAIDEAIKQYSEARIEADSLSIIGLNRDATFGLAKSFAAKGDFVNAYKNQLVASQLADSIQNWETAQKSTLIKLEVEQQKQEEKISQLENENARSKKERLIFLTTGIVVLASLVAVVVLVSLNNSQRAQTNQLLVEKNEEIASQNEQLKEVNNVKNTLFSIIGHDLRSPLNSLKAMLGMVVRKQITPEEFSHFAPKLHQHVLGVGETLENLLLWSRSQMEGWTNNPTEINLYHSVDKIYALFNETAKEKNIVLINRVDLLHKVKADENQLELILRNLVHNAIKFTESNGKIEIASEEDNDFIHVKISDTVIGMSNEKIDQLFSVSLSSKGTFGERGTGLGLLLSKEMAENNDGKLSVTSKEGEGTCFTVFLRKA